MSAEPIDEGATLQDVLEAVGRYLLTDAATDEAIKVALATATAHALTDEEPLWTIIVGPSSGSKTEIIRLCKELAHAQPDEITRAGLLSWGKVGKEIRRMGLLAKVPRESFCTVADFSTVVTMGDRDARSRIFGALRRIYDGELSREIAGGTGDDLAWSGHLTLLIASTPVLETHFSAEAALGERWVLVRLAEAEGKRSTKKAMYAATREDLPVYRENAQRLAAHVVRKARSRIPARLDDDSIDGLAHLATLCAFVRTGVPFEGQGKYRVVLGEVSPEEPMRLMGQLDRLARCLIALGETEQLAVAVAARVALASVPRTRMAVMIQALKDDPKPSTVKGLMAALQRSNFYSTRWELEALEAIGLVVRLKNSAEEAEEKSPPGYLPTDEARELWLSAGALVAGTHAPNRGEVMEGGSTSEPPQSAESSENGVPALLCQSHGFSAVTAVRAGYIFLACGCRSAVVDVPVEAPAACESPPWTDADVAAELERECYLDAIGEADILRLAEEWGE